MAVHKTLQPDGTCWECDASGALPVLKANGTHQSFPVEGIGWQCECGRWWPVLIKDVGNWVRAWKKNMEVFGG